MTSYPAIQKTWTISSNNTITFVSLVATTGGYMKGLADFWLAHGMTCKGSCDGTTGAMDGVNRWTTVGNASVRGATTVAANSWMALTDGNGCNILMSFVGASDDIARFSFSPGGLYVAAGTATFTPTATDEAVLSTGVTVIGATASLDRTWNAWVDSEAKLARTCVLRSGVLVGMVWGVEKFNLRSTQTLSPAVWGFAYLPAQFVNNTSVSGLFETSGYQANNRNGLSKRSGVSIQVGCGTLAYQVAVSTLWSDVQTENQGSSGYPIFGPLGLSCKTTSHQGVLGYLYDWWTGRGTVTVGDTYNSPTKNFVQWGNQCPLWPWDGSTPTTGGSVPGTQLGNAHANMPEISYGTHDNGNSTYVPLAFSSVAPTGPQAVTSFARRSGMQVVRLQALTDDPPAEAGRVLVYTRTINGQQLVFSRYPDGTIYQVGAS